MTGADLPTLDRGLVIPAPTCYHCGQPGAHSCPSLTLDMQRVWEPPTLTDSIPLDQLRVNNPDRYRPKQEAKAMLTNAHDFASPDLFRRFDTGATRSADTGRYDPEGFMSPIVIERFCEYMNKHRVQPDGSVRDSDNWQKGIPVAAYLKGAWRHFLHLWTRMRGWVVQDQLASVDIEEDLCALMFNVQGLLFEVLKHKRVADAGAIPMIGVSR